MEIKTAFIKLTFDDNTAKVAVRRVDSQGWAAQDILPMIKGSFGSIMPTEGPFRIRKEPFVDALGAGECLSAVFTNLSHRIELDWRIQVYSNRPWVAFAADVKNCGDILDSIMPAVGTIIPPVMSGECRALINSGCQSASGSIEMKKSVKSEFVTAIYDPVSNQGMGLGFYSYRRAWCDIELEPGSNHGVTVCARSLYYGHNLADDGKAMLGESLLFDFSLSPLDGLESYAQAVELQVKPRFNHSATPSFHNAWCIYQAKLDGKNQMEEARRMSEGILSRYYGVSLISPGLWQKQYREKDGRPCSRSEIGGGNWYGFGEEQIDERRYDIGLNEYFSRLSALGLTMCFGMFYALAGSMTTVARTHPEWIVGGVIDYSNPQAREWLARVIKPFAQQHIAAFWTDFNRCGQSGPIYDKRMVKGFENARAGMRVIRDVVGPDVVIGTYDSAVGCFVGLVDRVRMAIDAIPDALGNWNALRNITGNMAAAYFYHQRLWINDPDPVLVNGTKDDPSTLDEARFRVALGVCSGGPIGTGERFYDFMPDRMHLLTQALPPLGTAARPLDLMRRDVSEEYYLRVQTGWDNWDVILYLNSSETNRAYRIVPLEIGLAENCVYEIFDFWPQQWLGEFKPSLTFDVSAHSSRVILIRKKPAHPWVLSTDMHVTQGAVELSRVEYDQKTGELKGRATRHPGAVGRISIIVPAGFEPTHADASMEGNPAGGGDRVLSLIVNFDKRSVDWSVIFRNR